MGEKGRGPEAERWSSDLGALPLKLQMHFGLPTQRPLSSVLTATCFPSQPTPIHHVRPFSIRIRRGHPGQSATCFLSLVELEVAQLTPPLTCRAEGALGLSRERAVQGKDAGVDPHFRSSSRHHRRKSSLLTDLGSWFLFADRPACAGTSASSILASL